MPLTAVTTQLAFNGRQRQVALQCVKRASKVTYCQPTLALTCQATLSYDMLDKLTYPLGQKLGKNVNINCAKQDTYILYYYYKNCIETYVA